MEPGNNPIIKFWKAQTKEELITIIKGASYSFLILGGLNILSSFFMGITTFIDGIIWITLGLLLIYSKSRTIAIIILLISIISFITTVLNIAGIKVGGGKNLLLAIIILYIALANVYTTFKYQKLKNT